MSDKKYYYIYPFKFNNCTEYLIWYQNDKDGFILDSNQKVIVFKTIESAINYNLTFEIEYDKELTEPIDLDILNKWLESPHKISIDCELFLTAWNFFADLSNSLEDNTFDINREITNPIYDKLFWGNNLPSVTPEDKYYEPIWTKEEIEKIKEVFIIGIELFKKSLEG